MSSSPGTQVSFPLNYHEFSPLNVAEERRWFAVKTRPRHEKRVAADLRTYGITSFVPLARELHRWSDRHQKVEIPVFPGYAFVQIAPEPRAQVNVLRVNGVLYFVGANGRGTPIPEQEIESLQRLLLSEASFSSCGFLKVGQRVRIRSGSLDGLEGILVAQDRKLVISVELIQKSISISLEGYSIEPV